MNPNNFNFNYPCTNNLLMIAKIKDTNNTNKDLIF